MKAKLGVLNNNNVIIEKNIDENEYNIYSNYKACLIDFYNDSQFFKIVHANHKDYINCINKYSNLYKNSDQILSEINDVKLEIERYIINYLTAVRLFLDHSETILNRKHGKNSNELLNFKKVCSEFYDNNFSYRFIYRLRNYVQHCGLPLGSLEFIKKLEKNSKNIERKLEIYFSKFELLNNFNSWGNLLKKDLTSLPDEFEVTIHINNMMKYLQIIYSNFIGHDLENTIIAAKYIKKIIQPIENKEGMPSIIFLELNKNNLERINFEFIPINIIEYVLKLLPNGT